MPSMVSALSLQFLPACRLPNVIMGLAGCVFSTTPFLHHRPPPLGITDITGTGFYGLAGWGYRSSVTTFALVVRAVGWCQEVVA